MITRHTLEATILTPWRVDQLAPITCRIARDEDWAPYVQADLEILTPDRRTLDIINPRQSPPPRIILHVAREAAQPLTSAGLTGVYGHRTLEAMTESMTGAALPTVTSSFGAEWQQPPVPEQRKALTLWVYRLQTDHDTGRSQVTLVSGEALLQDYALSASTPWRPPGRGVRALVSLVLARIGHTLSASSLPDPTELDYESLVWEPGVSAWEFLAPLLQVAGRRLYCDENGLWHLEPRQSTKPGNLSLRVGIDAIVTASEGSVRADDWADAVVVTYSWRDLDGNDRIAYDLAQAGPRVTRTAHFEYSVPYPGAGAARRLLRRAFTRGRGFEATIVSDYDATPGQTVTLESPSAAPSIGYLARTEWEWPSARTVLRTRGVATASPNAWGFVPVGMTWRTAPPGLSWRNADRLVPVRRSPYAWALVAEGLAWSDVQRGVSWNEADQLITKENTNG